MIFNFLLTTKKELATIVYNNFFNTCYSIPSCITGFFPQAGDISDLKKPYARDIFVVPE